MGSAAGHAAAEQIKAVVIRAEPGGLGHGDHGGFERSLEPVRNSEVSDEAAGRADQVVVVMIGEIFGQLKASELIGAVHAMDDTARLQDRQVSVGRALRQAACVQDLCCGEGSARREQHLHETTPTGGVALVVPRQPCADREVEVFGHAVTLPASPPALVGEAARRRRQGDPSHP